MKIWKLCVIAVQWNKPPYKPIPLSKKVAYKAFLVSIIEEIKIKIVILE